MMDYVQTLKTVKSPDHIQRFSFTVFLSALNPFGPVFSAIWMKFYSKKIIYNDMSE